MSTTPTTHNNTDTDPMEDTRDALIDSGFLPADSGEDFEPAWIARRYDAWRKVDTDPFGDLYLVNFTDDELTVNLTTHNGVIRTTVRFGTDPSAINLFRHMMELA